MIPWRRKETKVSKFRKKPIVIEAFQMTNVRRWDNNEWPEWLNEAWQKDIGEANSLWCDVDPPHDSLHISTLEGVLNIDWNDWIIKGVQGELYPCKPDIFEATYDPEGD